MADERAMTWWSVFKIFAARIPLAVFGLLLAVAVVALVSDMVVLRKRGRRSKEGEEEPQARSGIYSGHVWHARFKPTVHRFSYPIFYCLLDLDELDEAFSWHMWPVGSVRWPALARFRSSDHLKGKSGGNARAREGEHDVSAPPRHAHRVRDMVEAAVGTRPTGRVQLLTHLAYLGYCFNPVSFYYCLDASEERIETVVAEVSNTPWGEMHCYVLDPRTQGVEVVSEDKNGLVRYRFAKDFHVSPFMGMNHEYDWRFTPPLSRHGSVLTAQTTLLEPTEDRKIFFDAKLVLKRHPFTAAGLCWHMAVYPMYTVWVQVLIHYQAFRLWCKKVPFFPHPEGSETAASRLVGTIMTPLFNAQEAWSSRRRRGQSISGDSVSDAVGGAKAKTS